MLGFILLISSLAPFYLIGCIPTGYLIAKASGIDITLKGSGNVGAANVLRNLGRRAGIFTLIGDMSKGYVACALGYLLSPLPYFSYLCALAVVAGHCFSIPGKFKGGKGVATSLGALLFLDPYAAMISLATFGMTLWLSKIVSLASIIAALITPITACFSNASNFKLYCLAAIAILITFRHKTNLQRLIAGKEPKMTQGAS